MISNSIVLMSDRTAATPVQEHGKALLDARVHGLMVDDRKQDAAGAWSHVLQGVLTRRQRAQSLLPGATVSRHPRTHHTAVQFLHSAAHSVSRTVWIC
ncbi:hypothetical protein [Streptomyces sp. NPDC059215]|uniref:hypothetical protein n=1 Tax=Streptomyces sp. NPDC059215 TaxID=3346772 RepID=UPI00367501C3